MSLSTSIASSRGPGGPRKHTGSINNPKPHVSSRKQQSTNSEEEISQRQQRNRQNANKSACCLISVSASASLPAAATTLLVSVALVCLSVLQEMEAT